MGRPKGSKNGGRITIAAIESGYLALEQKELLRQLGIYEVAQFGVAEIMNLTHRDESAARALIRRMVANRKIEAVGAEQWALIKTTARERLEEEKARWAEKQEALDAKAASRKNASNYKEALTRSARARASKAEGEPFASITMEELEELSVEDLLSVLLPPLSVRLRTKAKQCAEFAESSAELMKEMKNVLSPREWLAFVVVVNLIKF